MRIIPSSRVRRHSRARRHRPGRRIEHGRQLRAREHHARRPEQDGRHVQVRWARERAQRRLKAERGSSVPHIGSVTALSVTGLAPISHALMLTLIGPSPGAETSASGQAWMFIHEIRHAGRRSLARACTYSCSGTRRSTRHQGARHHRVAQHPHRLTRQRPHPMGRARPPLTIHYQPHLRLQAAQRRLPQRPKRRLQCKRP